jgi:hypothetical protein
MAKEHIVGSLYEFEQIDHPETEIESENLEPTLENYRHEKPRKVTLDMSDVSSVMPLILGKDKLAVDWGTAIYFKGSEQGVFVLTGYERIKSLWAEEIGMKGVTLS